MTRKSNTNKIQYISIEIGDSLSKTIEDLHFQEKLFKKFSKMLQLPSEFFTTC